MRHQVALSIAIGVAIAGFAAGPLRAAQQSSSQTTETRAFEVVSVDGNKVVVKDQKGTEEITVPGGFMFTVDGKQVGVGALKPGMKGTATITTTTTVKPVTVTEVKRGEVMQASGSSIIVKTEEGFKMFGAGDLSKRNVTIMMDGKKVDFSGLHKGDILTATIVTEMPPQIMTERQVQATLATPAPRAAAGGGSAAGAAPPAAAKSSASSAGAGGGSTAGAGAGAAAPKKLPKTASNLPLVGLAGVVSLSFATLLAALRRRRAIS